MALSPDFPHHSGMRVCIISNAGPDVEADLGLPGSDKLSDDPSYVCSES